jgi:seryl-tRNA synthetase
VSDDRNDVLDAFSEFYNQINRCFIIAMEQDNEDEVKRLEKARAEARELNDQLLHTAYAAWSDHSDALLGEMTTINTELKGTLDELEKEGQAIKNVIFAIGKIEDVLVKVKKIFTIA